MFSLTGKEHVTTNNHIRKVEREREAGKACTYTHMHLYYVDTSVHVRMYVGVYVCMYVYMYVYMYMHMYMMPICKYLFTHNMYIYININK